MNAPSPASLVCLLALSFFPVSTLGQETEIDPSTPVAWGTPGGYASAPPPIHERIVLGTDERAQILSTESDPWRRNAHLEVTFPGGTSICTGFFLAANLVGTAGHCVYNTDLGGWATFIDVIPGRNGTGGFSEPFGRQSVLNVWSVSGWTSSGLPEWDYAALVLPDDTMGNQVGWYSLDRSSPAEIETYLANLAGYPGDKPFGTLWYDAKGVLDAADLVSYEIDTFGGQSGSAVYRIGTLPRRYVFAIHAYGSTVGYPCSQAFSNCGPRMRPEVLNFFLSLGAPIHFSGFETGDLSSWTASP